MGHRLDQARLAEAQRGAPQPSDPLEVAAAVVVVHVHALAADNDLRAIASLIARSVWGSKIALCNLAVLLSITMCSFLFVTGGSAPA